jgi:hypothetical protein
MMRRKKMTRKLIALSVVLSFVFFAGIASAQGGESIHKRIATQQHRIDKGVRSGELTRREADMLQGNLNHVRDAYAKARADGVLTPRELRRLNRMLDDNNAMIYKKKHNAIRQLY